MICGSRPGPADHAIPLPRSRSVWSTAMPASDPRQGRHVLRIVPFLFWGGVGLAPVAVVLIVVGQSSSLLRVGAALAMLVVVLIGLAVSLQRSAGGVPPDVEDMVLDELDALREDVREDITVAARATHKALGEKVVALHETVDALRAQVEHLRTQLAAGPPAPAQHPAGVHTGAHGHVGGGVVRHTETVQVTTRQTIVDPDEGRGTVYGTRSSEPPPRRAERSAPDEWPARGERTVSARAGVPAADPWAGPERATAHAGRPEPDRGDADRSGPRRAANSGRAANSARPGDDWPAPRMVEDHPAEESWTDKLLRERFAKSASLGELSGEIGGFTGDLAREPPGDRQAERSGPRGGFTDRVGPERGGPERGFAERRAPERGDRQAERGDRQAERGDRQAERGDRQAERGGPEWGDERAEREWDRNAERGPDRGTDRSVGRRRAPDRDEDSDRITGVRTGDRWASVRSDERGRELRMGERRAAVRADESGTELRIEDRWAAVRRDGPRSP